MDLASVRRLRFFEGLLSLYRGTGNLASALEFLAGRLGPRHGGEAARHAAARVAEGRPLSEALAEAFPDLGPVEIGLLRVGERSGEIERALLAITAEIRESRALTLELAARLAYPVLVLHLAGLVFTFIQSLSTGFSVLWPASYFGLLYAVAGAAWWLHRRQRTDPRLRSALLRVPLLGTLQKSLLRERFAAALGQLYGAGVPIAEALDIVAEALRADPAAAEIRAAAAAAREGEPLSRHLPPALDDALLRDAIEVGERAGTLSEHLDRAHGYYREKARRAARLLAQAVGWGVYAVAVGVVAYLAFRFYLGRLAAIGL